MFTALLANAAAVTLFMQPGTGNTQTAERDPLEDGWFGRSANWVENAGLNFLYHNEGSSARKFILNSNATVAGSNAYLTVNANTSGFFGMALHSPDDTAIPYYGYVLNSNLNGHLANHSYNPNTSSWTLSIEGTQSLIVDSNRDLLMPAGGVVADFYELNSVRSEFVYSSRLDPFVPVSGGGAVSRVHLRDGSEIEQFQARIEDLNPSANLQIYLVRTNIDAASLTPILAVSSSGSGSALDYSSSTIITAGTQFVDNSQYLYYIYYVPVANTTFRSARTQIWTSEL